MLLLKLAEQLVHQRVRDAVRVVLVGDDTAGETVAAHIEVHAVALGPARARIHKGTRRFTLARARHAYIRTQSSGVPTGQEPI